MTKTILITGATDGIGQLTAKMLADEGHTLLIHGRSAEKLAATRAQMGGAVETYQADLSSLSETAALAEQLRSDHGQIDVVINNAGVLKTGAPRLPDGQDVRFVVNTRAPYLLTKALLPQIPPAGRVINVASAAQAPVNADALAGGVTLADMDAYAQSKLALVIWTQELARARPEGPVFIAVNPGSLLASKMVREGFGIAGSDLGIGAGILCRLATEEAFAQHSGDYWDNDAGGFGPPHAAAHDPRQIATVMNALDDAG
ncbi:MAG: SDR family NAD(P)-dependent oxidoreductase [Pseudomonadota bacterium]